MTAIRPHRNGTDPEAFRRALLRVFLVVALAIAFLQRLATAQTADPERAATLPDPVPLQVGSTWTYEGQVWWIPWSRGRIYREQVTWTSEVTEVLHRGPWTAAMLEGHPYDLIRYEPGRERGLYVLLMRDRKKAGPRVYLASARRARAVWRRLQDREDTLKGLTLPGELVLDLPLHGGKRFCLGAPAKPAKGAPPAQVRPACWSVTDDGPADLRAVRGAEELLDADLFRLSQRTPSEHAVWTFVPGLGFTSFAYGYSGEVLAVELHLVDYHVPSVIGDTALER